MPHRCKASLRSRDKVRELHGFHHQPHWSYSFSQPALGYGLVRGWRCSHFLREVNHLAQYRQYPLMIV